ncbi:hypothetical protein BD779DRAFT_1231960 [Infundibulicybe gibba]|nr:hypothetical protein BD779DRAFT_1231960 [Infundibulicybe gibba]
MVYTTFLLIIHRLSAHTFVWSHTTSPIHKTHAHPCHAFPVSYVMIHFFSSNLAQVLAKCAPASAHAYALLVSGRPCEEPRSTMLFLPHLKSWRSALAIHIKLRARIFETTFHTLRISL